MKGLGETLLQGRSFPVSGEMTRSLLDGRHGGGQTVLHRGWGMAACEELGCFRGNE